MWLRDSVDRPQMLPLAVPSKGMNAGGGEFQLRRDGPSALEFDKPAFLKKGDG